MAAARSLDLVPADSESDSLYISGIGELPQAARDAYIQLGRELGSLMTSKDDDASNPKEFTQQVDVGGQDPEPRDPRAEQKTDERRLRAVKHPDEDESGNIPLPENWQDLAAYSGGSTRHVERAREWDDLGEDSQESHEDE
jgi:hypothetical protein